jgi:hypothetical protein
MIALRLNNRELDVTTVEQLGAALDVADGEEAFEQLTSYSVRRLTADRRQSARS